MADGSLTGGVRQLARAEGAAIATTALFTYAYGNHSWWLFAILFLAPDLSMAAYLAGPALGAAVYNAVHSYVLVALLILLHLTTGWGLALSLGLILASHIGFDRMLGYGLKYASAFGHTHLGRIGRGRSA
jgi:hypothetical protein